MKYYLVCDHTCKEDFEEPTVEQVTDKELFKLLDKARDGNLKIAVYEIGDCLLDWS